MNTPKNLSLPPTRQLVKAEQVDALKAQLEKARVLIPAHAIRPPVTRTFQHQRKYR